MSQDINTLEHTDTKDFSISSPLGCDSAWIWPTIMQDNLSCSLYDWLTHPGSLTARLKTQCQQFSVQVLIEGEYPLSDDERAQLNLTEPTGFIREVLLHLDGVPWVFARSVMPLSTIQKAGSELANLGSKPLGAVLFNSPDMQRSAIEIAEFTCDNALHNMLGKQLSLTTDSLFGRRSCFMLSGESLLVSEVFLPNAIVYKA